MKGRPPSRLVPVTQIKRAERQQWVDIPGGEDMPVNSVRNLAVRKMDVLVSRSDSGWHVFPNACPGTALPLHMGRISGETLFCPWRTCAFDVRTGKRTAGSGQDSKPLTLRRNEGRIQLGIWE